MTTTYSMKTILNETHSDNTHELRDEELKYLQNEMLSIYKDVFEVCERNNLKLFLQGGTLLGKVRHNGFIPWDDDMDFGMSRTDYNQFIKIFDKELSDKYILRAPGYKGGATTRFIHIYKKNSYLEYETSNSNTINKISIDIFPIDYAPNNKIVRYIKAVISNGRTFVTSSLEFADFCDDKTKEKLLSNFNGKMNYYSRVIVASLYKRADRDLLYAKLDREVSGFKKTQWCTSSMGRKHYLGELQPSDTFFPLKRTDFCGVDAWTLNHPERYLRHNYGQNFMEIPPKEKREKHFIIKLRA